MAAVDKAMERAQKAQRDSAAGPAWACSDCSMTCPRLAAQQQQDELPNIADWDEEQRLQHEKDVLGFLCLRTSAGKYAEKLRNLKASSTHKPRSK